MDIAKYDYDTWEALKQYFKERIDYTTYEEADILLKVAIIDSHGFQVWYLQKKVKELQNEMIKSLRNTFRRRKVS